MVVEGHGCGCVVERERGRERKMNLKKKMNRLRETFKLGHDMEVVCVENLIV